MKIKIQNMLITLALLAGIHQAAAQGTTAFTYQGQLRDGGTNANGAYTMIFKLYDALTSGNQIGSTLTTSPTLANGLFTVNLDFGGGAFNGNPRWLEINVAGDTLTPRVQVLPAPYAQFAAVAATVTNGAIMNAQLATNAVATANVQNGAVTDAKIVSVSGSKISGAVASANYATNAGSAATATIASIANSVADGSIVTSSLQDGAVTATKIASGQLVKSLNGLSDSVTLSAGANTAMFTNGNSLLLSACVPNIAVYGGGANATFTVPPNVTRIMVEMWGGGGGGGAGYYGAVNDGSGNSNGGAANAFTGGGGGAGGYAWNVFTVIPGTVYQITAGARGNGGIVGGANGATGSASSFGTLLTAGGGGGGINATTNSNGNGGSGGSSTGSLANVSGGNGDNNGNGGGVWRGSAPRPYNGNSSSGPGGGGTGGGGGFNSGIGSANSGNQGSGGAVIVYY